MKVIGLFARDHGYNGLTALIDSDKYDVVAVFTHKRNPKASDPSRGVRSDYPQFEKVCNTNNIPLYTVDSAKKKAAMPLIMKGYDADLVAAISWRMMLPKEQLDIPKYGCVNLHRGNLPEYAGAEPVVRAIQDRKEQVYICAHMMVEQVDAGKVLEKACHDVQYDHTKSLDENVERVKHELTPLFGPLLLSSLDKAVNGHD